MKTAAHLHDQFREAGAFFDVLQEPIHTESGKTIPNRLANIHGDTGEILGIVSNRYKVLPYEGGVVLPALHALETSGLDLSGSSVNIQFSKNGGQMLGIVTLPAHTIELNSGDKADPHQLQMLLRSSHDATINPNVQPGSIRLACLNGQYDLAAIGSIKGKHTSRFSAEYMKQQVRGLLEAFNLQSENWRRWSETDIIDDHAWHAIQMYTFTKKDQLDRGLEVYTERSRETKAVKMMDSYVNRDKLEIGATAWGLYNTLTHDATHSKRAEGKEATSTELKHGNVNRVVHSDFWNQQLLAA